MMGLQEARQAAANTIGANQASQQKLSIDRAMSDIEAEISKTKTMVIQLADRLEPYCDLRDINKPEIMTAKPYACAFEQRLNMTLDNVENINATLRAILDRVQL
jgi:hypothetical protein